MLNLLGTAALEVPLGRITNMLKVRLFVALKEISPTDVRIRNSRIDKILNKGTNK